MAGTLRAHDAGLQGAAPISSAWSPRLASARHWAEERTLPSPLPRLDRGPTCAMTAPGGEISEAQMNEPLAYCVGRRSMAASLSFEGGECALGGRLRSQRQELCTGVGVRWPAAAGGTLRAGPLCAVRPRRRLTLLLLLPVRRGVLSGAFSACGATQRLRCSWSSGGPGCLRGRRAGHVRRRSGSARGGSFVGGEEGAWLPGDLRRGVERPLEVGARSPAGEKRSVRAAERCSARCAMRLPKLPDREEAPRAPCSVIITERGHENAPCESRSPKSLQLSARVRDSRARRPWCGAHSARSER